MFQHVMEGVCEKHELRTTWGLKKKYIFRNKRIIDSVVGKPIYSQTNSQQRETTKIPKEKVSPSSFRPGFFFHILSTTLWDLLSAWQQEKRKKIWISQQKRGNLKKKFHFIRKPKKDLWLTSVHNENWLSFHMIFKKKKKSIGHVQVARMRWLLCWLIHWWHFSYEERNSAILCGILTALFLNHRRIDSSIPVEKKMESFQFSG